MTDQPTNPFATPETTPAPAPATQRPIAKRRGGWPKGKKRSDAGVSKAAKEASSDTPNTQHPMETPPQRDPAGVDLPKPYVSRHRLRPLEEYPADEAMQEKFHIPRNKWPTGFALQWQAISVWNQPLDDMRAAAARTGWEPVCPRDFDGRYAYKVPTGWGDKPIIIDGLMLQARDKRWDDYARARDKRDAQQVINIRVRQLHKGELEGISLDTQHRHLEKTNFVNASVDTVGMSGASGDID